MLQVADLPHQIVFREKTHPSFAVRRKANILIADDEPCVLKFLTAVLPADRYRISQACNGLEAILVWHQSKPIDLLIADVNMPGLDGPLVAEAIWVEKYIPVLYISGLPPADLAERHIQDGRA